MRYGPATQTVDRRKLRGRPLRKTEPLPLRIESSDKEDLYYHEAQTSSLCWGPDEWFWTEIFLVDTYFGSEPRLRTYLDSTKPGGGNDPPLGGGGTMRFSPHFDPREYFLRKLDRRFDQVAKEYSALIETFDQRMEEYVSTQLAAQSTGQA
jgi:hypothetical protein